MTAAALDPQVERAELSPPERRWRDRARKDFRFFCRSALKIKPKREISVSGKSGPLIPFEFNQAQEHVWRVMQEQLRAGVPIRIVVLKARQFGISTFFCAWIFWNLWRSTHKRAGIASFKGSKETTLVEMQETMNTFYQSFPPGFRPALRAGKASDRLNKYEIFWTDRNSSLKLVPAVADALRGPALDYVLCTEVASYQEPDEFFGGFVPTMNISPLSTLVLESSPKDGYFEARYKSAKRGEGGYRAVFLPWWAVPQLYSRPIRRAGSRARLCYDAATGQRVSFSPEERARQKRLSRLASSPAYAHFKINAISDEQMLWRQFAIDGEYQGDEEFFNQEFPEDDATCFFRATRSAFKHSLALVNKTVDEAAEKYPQAVIGDLSSRSITDPHSPQTVYFNETPRAARLSVDEIQERYGGLYLLQEPRPEYTYVIGADVADDAGAGLDDDYGEESHAYSVGCVYCCNTREQIAEWRGHLPPYDWGDMLVMLGYFYNTAMLNVEINSIGRSTYDRISRALLYPLTFRWPKFDEAGKLTKKEMWVTDAKTKQILIGSLRYAIDKGYFTVRMAGLRDELAGYTIKNGRYQSGSETYSDRIIAAALAWQCVEQTDFAPYRSIVYGASAPEIGHAQGAALVVRQSPRMSPPPQLPAEFGAPGVLSVTDVWDGAKL